MNKQHFMGILLILGILGAWMLIITGYIKFLDYVDPFPCKETLEKIESLKTKAEYEKDKLNKLKLETAMHEELQKYCRFCNCEE